MKVRGAMIQGGLAGLGLIAAYATWQREPERAAGEVMVLDAKKSTLERIRFEETVTPPPAPKAPDGGTAPPAPAVQEKWAELYRVDDDIWLKVPEKDNGPGKEKTPPRELRGNDGATKLYDKFAPLYARSTPRARSASSTRPSSRSSGSTRRRKSWS
jgi:hypothetical protein